MSRFGRTGLMVIYDSLEEFEADMDEVLACFGYQVEAQQNFNFDSIATSPPGDGYFDRPMEESKGAWFVGNDSYDPGPAVHTLNVFINSKKGGSSDEELDRQFSSLSARNGRSFRMACIRRITMCVHKYGHMPKYFTYRSRDDYKEDRIYRHLEPALAFQLELSRLRNFALNLIPTANHRMHLYHGVAKAKDGGKSTIDQRYFVRAIIRHADLVTHEASFMYLKSEGERLLIESLDELEVAIRRTDNKAVDQNHVFLNFAPSVSMPVNQLVSSIRDVVVKYGRRFLELRVTQAELKFNIRSNEDNIVESYRIFLSSDNGFRLQTHLYREVIENQTTVFRSFGDDPGPLNGLSTDTAYTTKDLLQTARYKAQSAGCAYVYDYPTLFEEGIKVRDFFLFAS